MPVIRELHLKIKSLIEIARSQIGKPYIYGACRKPPTEEPEGFDCSSFTQWCFSQLGIELPRSSIEQASCSIGHEVSNDLAIPVWTVMSGDLIFFEGTQGHYNHTLFPNRKIHIGHVAICTDSSRIIHACKNHHYTGVVEHSIINLPEEYYPVVFVRRIII